VRAVVTVAEMARIDQEAQAEVGIETLIARAGHEVARLALEILGGSYGRRIVVVAGKGHNGDDGRVASQLLARRGAVVTVVSPAPTSAELPSCDLVIDAAFGTGFRGQLSGATCSARGARARR